jgi:hypothetical protein
MIRNRLADPPDYDRNVAEEESHVENPTGLASTSHYSINLFGLDVPRGTLNFRVSLAGWF